MRKLKLQMQLSLDGFVAGENGEMDWLNMNWDQALMDYVTELTTPVDCILLGRKLAQGFIPHWKAAAIQNPADKAAKIFSETAKVVFSTTISQHDWANTTIATNVEETVRQLKQQEGGDMIVYGGASFVSHLINANLIDEYHFFINPVLLGKGMPIFQALQNRLPLNLQKATTFDCGIVVLCYTHQ